MKNTTQQIHAPKAIFEKNQQDMSSSQEQASREYINAMLTAHGKPVAGKIHLVCQKTDSEVETIVLDTDLYPESAVFALMNTVGDYSFYNQQGYQVFAD